MAERDKKQGVGFVKATDPSLDKNVYELFKRARAAAAVSTNSPITAKTRVWKAENLEDLGFDVYKFNPPPLKRTSPGFEELKVNLNRLDDLHSRLRFMLKELEDLVGKKKK